MERKKDGANRYRQELQKEGARKKGLRVLLIVLLALLGALIVAAGIWMAETKLREKAYFDHIREADKYLTEMNYAGAELSYLKAIEKVPDRVEAYSGLSAIYIAQERWDEAQTLLARGIQVTNSEALFKTYEQVMLKLDDSVQLAAVMADTADVDGLSEDITIDASLFDVAAAYTYTDYVQHCGRLLQNADNAMGGCDLKFEGYAGTLSYYNIADDYFIYDAQSRLPYAVRRPNEIRFAGMGDIFGNYQGAVSFSKLQELFGEGVRIEEDDEEERYQVVISYHRCTLYVDCDAEGNILGAPENKLIPPPQNAESTEQEEGSLVSGYVINVMNGGGVQAKLRFLKGGQYGTAEKETETKFDGNFEARLPAGHYTAEISAAGFITGYEEIEVTDYADLTGLNFALSPRLEEGEIRIVLTWGAAPADLDSHLEGRSVGGSYVHISYRDMEAGGVAKLDLDDRSGYGPETTTIYDAGGSYTFTVHDFTNGNNSASTQLASSGAVVKIYLPGSSQPVTYTVPSGSGTYWTVCRIENGQITPVNTIR